MMAAFTSPEGIGTFKESRWRDLNPRPADYKSAALPTELRRRTRKSPSAVFYFAGGGRAPLAFGGGPTEPTAYPRRPMP